MEIPRSSRKLDVLRGFGLQPGQDPEPQTLLDLSVAENWVIRPEVVSVLQDTIQTLRSEHLSYSNSVFGDRELLQALAAFVNEHFRPYTPVQPANIAIGPGASSCLDALMHQICNPGEGVLVPAPFWNGFDFHFTIHADVHPVVAQPLWKVDPDTLITALTQAYDDSPRRIRALVLTNPGNPLGQCLSRDVLQRCALFCHQRDLHLICDEIYALSCFAPNPFESILALDLESLGCDISRVHMVWSLSKDFGCSGLRMGCIVTANPSLRLSLSIPLATQVSSLTALCTTALLTSPALPALIKLNAERLADSYKTITSFLDSRCIEYVPATAGLCLLARLAPETDEAEEQRRMRKEGLLVSPGRIYHLGPHKGWFRLTFALEPEQLKHALVLLGRYLDASRAERSVLIGP